MIYKKPLIKKPQTALFQKRVAKEKFRNTMGSFKP